MHPPESDLSPRCWPFGGHPAGITVHIEFRVRALADRRRRRRRRGGWWPYHERRRQARRLHQRRRRRDLELERAVASVLRRLAVRDPSARRILAGLSDASSPADHRRAIPDAPGAVHAGGAPS